MYTRDRRRASALRKGSAILALAALWTVSATQSAPAAEQRDASAVQPVDASPKPPSDAYARAKATGRPVEKVDARTPTVEEWANPDGTVTRRQHLRPVRTNIGGDWQPVDATLRMGSDGRIAPVAPVFGISFSAGGRGALATMTKGGKSLSLSWPTPLPEPRVDGATATYPEVLPGIDLKLIADVDGVTQHLVVKTREAAADPALKEVRYAVAGNGLTLTTRADGGLVAQDTAGTPVFKAPPPSMWGGVSTAAAGRTAVAAEGEARGVDPADTPVKAVPVAVSVESDTLKLTPDAALLAAADTVFPVVVDPVFSDGWREDWTIAYKRDNDAGAASTSYWNGQHFDDKQARVGYENDSTARSYGTAESYFELNTDGLAGSTIISANVNFFNEKSWSCTARSVELGLTDQITSATTWNNRPTWVRTLQTKNFAHGWGAGCTPAGEDFNADEVKNAVQQAANGNWENITLGLRAPGATGKDPLTWKKFANNPYLEVTYNRPPHLEESSAWLSPWNPGGAGNVNLRCDADPATWPTIGNTDITLTARVSDPDGGNVQVGFSLWEYAGGGVSDPVVEVAQNSLAHVTIPIAALQDGHRYKWIVHGSDNLVDTGWTAHCGFTVDKSAPAKPTVTPIDGKRIDIAQAPARTPRVLRLRARDNVGVTSFCYLLNRYLSTGNGDCEGGISVPARPDPDTTDTDDYIADITITPGRFPESRLYVRAYDKAGNRSLLNVGNNDLDHQFDWATVPADGDAVTIKTQPVDWVTGVDSIDTGDWDDRDGDLTGDGRPDVVTISNDGILRLYPGIAERPLGEGYQIGWGWAGVKLAHRGDFTGPYTTQFAPPDGFEDYFAALPQPDGTYRLILYPNDGTGIPDPYTRKEIPHPGGGNWPAGLQILTPGDATGDGYPDLVTIEGGDDLFIYPGDPNGGVDLAKRTRVAGGGWSAFDVIAPGDINGDGVPDLIGRLRSDNPADGDFGKLFLYPGTRPTGQGSYGIGERAVYGSAGWNPANRPLLASSGNNQGTVETRTQGRVWVPTPGSETPDLFATGPGGAGNEGILYYYAGKPTTHEPGVNIGEHGWTSYVIGIY
ncbi:FG-GAP-like repeat-containing protein [Embleya sp. MST-111070]|uniref:FG-GAP-like repeat-containing protein n=1 Tax=Embleya sp. MST-111070 TaxID=3398231 RepID=UPI003F737C50